MGGLLRSTALLRYANRLVSINGGAGASYVYDADGKRVSRSAAGLPTRDFIYDLGGNVVAEWQPTGFMQGFWGIGYVYLGGQMVAQYSNSTTYFVHKDHLGSTRLLTKMDKSVQDSMDYLPYGEQIAGDTTTNHKFTGKERDIESGLDYFGARYYGSNMGRFQTPDPSGLLAQNPMYPQSWNLYVYARNNPLIYIDPDGLDCIYATDNGQGVESIDHNSSSGECGKTGGTWLSGYVDEDWAHYNNKAGAFEAASEDGGQVNFAQFQAGALTNDNGNCLSGCGSYGFASADAGWLTKQLVGNSKPTDGSDPLDGLLTFMTGRAEKVSGFWKAVAGPLDPSKDNWAGPDGMGPPGGTGDWRAAVHDYNFLTNHITIGSYFNPHLSRATSKALIQSNNNLMRTGGVQGAKEKIFFGIVNAFQWYSNSWK